MGQSPRISGMPPANRYCVLILPMATITAISKSMSTMEKPEKGFVFYGCSDFSGIVRGRSFPARMHPLDSPDTVGWVPADQSLTPFGEIGPSNPFGPVGDLRLKPAENSHYSANLNEADSALHFFLCDILDFDGSPWECCARDYLRRGVNRLRQEFGLEFFASFEHEFTLVSKDREPEPVFSLRAQRQDDELLCLVSRALDENGMGPEMVLPEYGKRQFEITMPPRAALEAADDAVAFREIVRDCARVLGQRVTFSPIVGVGAVSNGVHVHFSVRRNGEPANFSEGGEGGLSPELASICAGILHNAGSVTAMSSPSVVSYERLKPHHWSAAYRCIGSQNREAAIRVCPAPPGKCSKTFHHAELRIGDATASPYLHLGSIVHAGIDGLENNRELPEFVNSDPGDLSRDELNRLGIRQLPQSLEQALIELDENEIFKKSASSLFWQCYLDMKETERKYIEGNDLEEQIRMYQEVY